MKVSGRKRYRLCWVNRGGQQGLRQFRLFFKPCCSRSVIK